MSGFDHKSVSQKRVAQWEVSLNCKRYSRPTAKKVENERVFLLFFLFFLFFFFLQYSQPILFDAKMIDVLLHTWSNKGSFEPREWSKEWQKWKTHFCTLLKFVVEKSMPKSEPSEVNHKWTGTKVVCGNKIVWRSSIHKRASKWQIRWRRSLF